MTGDLDRQLKISAHISQSALRPHSLAGATKQLILLELSVLWEGRMEKGAGRTNNIGTCCRSKWVMRCMLVAVGSRGFAGDFLLLSLLLSRAAIKSRLETVAGA